MSNVTVHIDEDLNQRSFLALGQEIQGLNGVAQVDYTERHPHLMVVSYDNQVTDSAHVLQAFTGQGLHAELIGF